MARTTADATAAPAAPSDSDLLATAKAAAGRAQQRQIVLAVERAAARRRAEHLAAERRVWAARAAAKAAAARAAAARAAAAKQAAQQAAAPAPAQPAASGSPQQIAEGMLASFGWSSDQFSCLDSLWERESGWNVYADNTSSGAYGIPQALPGSKMASAGPDWQSDAATQIRWGLGYIQASYGSPCGAWDHEEADGWY